MKRVINGIIFTVASFIPLQNYTQTKFNEDSLNKIIKANVSDTNTIRAYYAFFNMYRFFDSKRAAEYNQKGFDMARKIKFERGVQAGYVNKAVFNFYNSEFDSAIFYCKEVVKFQGGSVFKSMVAESFS